MCACLKQGVYIARSCGMLRGRRSRRHGCCIATRPRPPTHLVQVPLSQPEAVHGVCRGRIARGVAKEDVLVFVLGVCAKGRRGER